MMLGWEGYGANSIFDDVQNGCWQSLQSIDETQNTCWQSLQRSDEAQNVCWQLLQRIDDIQNGCWHSLQSSGLPTPTSRETLSSPWKNSLDSVGLHFIALLKLSTNFAAELEKTC